MAKRKTPRRARGETEPPLSAAEARAIALTRAALADADRLRGQAAWYRRLAEQERARWRHLEGPDSTPPIDFDLYAANVETEAIRVERSMLKTKGGGRAFRDRAARSTSLHRAWLAADFALAYAFAVGEDRRTVARFSTLPLALRRRLRLALACARGGFNTEEWHKRGGDVDEPALVAWEPHAAAAFDAWATAAPKESIEKGGLAGPGIGAASRAIGVSPSTIWRARDLAGRSALDLVPSAAGHLDTEWAIEREDAAMTDEERKAQALWGALITAAQRSEESKDFVRARSHREAAKQIRDRLKAQLRGRLDPLPGPYSAALQRRSTW